MPGQRTLLINAWAFNQGNTVYLNVAHGKYLSLQSVRQVYQNKSRDTSEDESVFKYLTSKLKSSLARQAGDKTS